MTAPATNSPAPLKPWQAARRRIVAWERRVDGLADEARRVAGECLGAAGYHRHDRGGWRLRRREGGDVAGDLNLTRVDRNETADLMMASSARGRRSADAARAHFDKFVALDPKFEPLLIKIEHGDLVHEIESDLIDRLGKGEHVRREAIRRHAERFRRDLLGADEPSAIEHIVVGRAVVCYLALHLAEAELIAWDDRRPRSYAEKRVDGAQRRLLAVLKALDDLRKRVPTVHLAQVRVLGDLVIAPPAPAEPAPPAIDVTPQAERIEP